jgi:phosphatidylserine synthase 2
MVYAVLIIALISVIELNAFFLKFILWVPPPHPINIVRLLIWWGIGMPGLREFYHWAVDK